MNLSGSPFDFAAAFLGGVAVSFTPCVFPLIPVTAGYIGARSAGSRWTGFSLGFVYVTGVALTYAALGIIASLTGSMFGRISGHPATRLAVGLIVAAFGFAMLDLFHIPVPRLQRAPALQKGSYISTFALGLTSGFAVAPCTTPVLGSILVVLSQNGNVVYGGFLLLCFAYGMGAVLLLSAVFSTLLTAFPKAGPWMNVLKKVYAAVLFAVAAYFIIDALRRFLS
ncbi:MAG: cytochrome c biogenesis protein CcdA [Candidatus Omnitrophica bacterium]|nr:cytochrome c biogenesis protein CcdA [Candidatus Omnitrophota bacterium]MDD5774957.1 cytochrome c biogenesis protein CcdA [Candidatus Omnitrophota bacterium]